MSQGNMIANRYQVIKHIGQGGMADVYVAIDTILNREVAVKVLRGELSSDHVAVLRFQREAKAATSLSHPNIVDIYDVGEDRGHHFIVMEYVRGKTLKQLIQQRGALCNEEAVDIMKQLVSAVSEAHKKGVIHRDIKPQNVLVKDDGTIKLGDFGIAFTQDALQLTQSDSVMGSVHYLAPELAKGESASFQSDIYSLGIVFYELVTGDVPFKAEQAVQVALMQVRNELPSVRSINPGIPQSIENIIIRSTAKNKSYRYSSANEMYHDVCTCLNPERVNEKKVVIFTAPKSQETITIRQLKDDGSVEMARTTPNTSSQPRVRRVVKKRKKLNISAVLGILLTVFGIVAIIFALVVSGIFGSTANNNLATVPQLLNANITDAKQMCNDEGLILDTATITYTLTDDVEKGLIISVDPAVGTEVPKGTHINVSISSGIAETCPDFVGMNINEAQDIIATYPNIKATFVEQESDQPSGTVIDQQLLTPGTKFNPETETNITIVYSQYQTITIPNNIYGMTLEDATAALQALGCEVMVSRMDTSSYSEDQLALLQTGTVIRTNPEAGTEYTQTNDSYIMLFYYDGE